MVLETVWHGSLWRETVHPTITLTDAERDPSGRRRANRAAHEVIHRVLEDGQWHTLAELASAANAPIDAAQAAIRRYRHQRTLESRRQPGRSAYEYRVRR